MESFLDKLVASADNPQPKVIDSSRAVATLDTDHHGEEQGHGHGHDHGAVNLHIWLDPLRAVQQLEAIRDGLVMADLQRVAAEMKRSQLKALLSEPQEGNRSFNALASDLGVTIVAFAPLETASEQASLDPATCLTVMRRNATDLRQAFGP